MKKMMCWLLVLLISLEAHNSAFGDQPFGFTGEDQDANAVYLRDRYYDPQTGSFLTKDPLGVSGGPNQYIYIGNNPVNNTDPNGDNPLLITGGIGALVGGVLGFGITYWKTGNVEKSLLAGGAGAGTGFLVGSGGFLIAGAVGEIGLGGVVAADATLGGTTAAGNNYINQVGDHVIDGESLSIAVGDYNGTQIAISGATGFVLGGAGAPFTITANAADETAANAASQVEPAVNNLNLLYNSYLGTLLPTQIYDASVESNEQIITDALETSNTAAAAKSADFTVNQIAIPAIQTGVDAGLDAYFQPSESNDQTSTSSLSVGGVLINEAATLVGTNLSSIQGATYDPTTNQIVFLGSQGSPNSTLTNINMDYYYTAIQAVYGSATPPYVTLDPPASPATQWPYSQTFTNNSTQGFVMLYNPLWVGQDTTVGVLFRMTDQAGNQYEFTYNFNCVELDPYDGVTIDAGGRYAMGLVYSGMTVSPGYPTPPSGLSLNTAPFDGIPSSMTLNSSGQTSYWPVELTNLTGGNLVVQSVTVIPARQHREYGGRVDGTKLGWVMYEADRVMKCLAVGKDNLTGASYSSTSGNVNVTGYKNLQEIAQSLGDTGGYNRMWFTPDNMTLQQYINPSTGQATIGFQSSTVQLLTQAYLQGLPPDPAATQFATFFTQNYSAFATQSFPVEDPVTPSQIDSVPIFQLLQQAMQAVCLARFFHDNNIPLDNWWMSSYTPPVANSPLTVATAYNEAPSGSSWYLLTGGVQIFQPNTYVPSSNAQNMGAAVLSSRPSSTSSSAQDVPGQVWTVNSTNGPLVAGTAVSSSLQQSSQDGNVNLAEPDLTYASPGTLPLQFTRYYQSSWTNTTNNLGPAQLGPGWRDIRYGLQFSNLSWYDQYHLLTDSKGNPITTQSNGDTYLHSGAVRLVDFSSGSYLNFTSSLSLAYSTNAQGNPVNTISGLSANDLPTFSAGNLQNGATLVQNTDGTFDYTATLPDGAVLLFDPNGNLLQTTDKHGHKQTYAYTSGKLSTVTDDAGQQLTLTYSSSTGLLSSVAGSNGESITYHYNTNDLLTSVVSGLSNVVVDQYSYTNQNDSGTYQLATVTRMDGTVPITTSADFKGRSSSLKDVNGNTTNYTYVKNGDGSRTTSASLVNSGLSTVQKKTDSMGRTMSIQNLLGYTTSYSYTGSSLLPNSIQLPTPNRPAIQITRNGHYQPTAINDPAQVGASPIQISYNSGNNLVSQITDGAQHATNFYYTGHNNLQTLRRYHNGANVDTNYGYDSQDNLNSVEDPLGHTWQLGHDSLGRLTSETDPTGVQGSFTYDQYGNLSTVTVPGISGVMANGQNVSAAYGYDSLHRLTSVATPTGTITYTYNPVTQFLNGYTQQDNQGHTLETVSYGYNNSTGQVTSTSSSLSQPGSSSTSNIVTDYGYNSLGQLQTITPSGSSPISYNYNAAGQLISTADTDSGPAVGPTIIASAASNGVWTKVNSQNLTWGAPESSLPVTGYSYAEDGTAGTSVNTTGNSLAWNNISDGKHIFAMRAEDSAGNWSPQSFFNLWVDSNPPAVTNVNVTPSPIPQGTVTVTVSANITDAGSGLSGTPEFQWRVDSGNWSGFSPMSGSGSNWSASFSEHGGGTLYYQISSQDVAGNSGTYNGSVSISGPSGDSGPLMPPMALLLLAILFFGAGNWLLRRRQESAKELVR